MKFEGMNSCHPIVLLIKVGLLLILDQVENLIEANMTIYQRLIGKLMYLGCQTQPDIAFVIEQLSCHDSDLWADYLHIAKQVL